MTILYAAELATGITQAMAIEHLPARDEVRDAWATTEKSARLLEYRDATPLADGVASMWDWARDAWHRHPERRIGSGPTLEIAGATA